MIYVKKMDNLIENTSPANNDKCSKKAPFSSAEKELLSRLINDRPIVENKQSNAKIIELKRAAWNEIENTYNKVPYVTKRTALQLRRCWENMKSNQKKELSIEAIYLRQSEGGTGIASTTENIQDSICPNINLPGPGVIDSNIEDSELDNNSKPYSEVQARIKQCKINMDQDLELHKWRVQREKILFKKEEICIAKETQQKKFQEEIHYLQAKKLKLEIALLEQQLK